MIRDYTLVERLTSLPDDILIDVDEVVALTGFARVTVQQRRIKGFPSPLTGVRRLKWRLGDVRAWIRARTQQPQNASRYGKKALA
ncbi:MAG: hypothetical protein HZB40_01570 [Rhodocyclales bacterium]|nr:hypothetical protein [Rhodocyclales bacterium]